jgi:hypothetical protein
VSEGRIDLLAAAGIEQPHGARGGLRVLHQGVPTANPKLLTNARESVDILLDERLLVG